MIYECGIARVNRLAFLNYLQEKQMGREITRFTLTLLLLRVRVQFTRFSTTVD